MMAVEPDCLLLCESGNAEQNQLPLSNFKKQRRNFSKESFLVERLTDFSVTKDVIKSSDTYR